MAVSAYVSLLSLTQFLDNLHYRAQFNIPRADINQIETLRGHVRVLLEIVQRRSEEESEDIKALWTQIAEAAFEAEHKINFHVVSQLHTRSRGKSDEGFSDFCEAVERLIQKFHSIQKQLPTIKELHIRSQAGTSDEGFSDFREDVEGVIKKFHTIMSIKEEGEDVQAGKQPGASVPAPSTATSSWDKGVVVGLEDHISSVIHTLSHNDKKNLQIFPIVGMGGIGKTTLAKCVYEDPFLVRHFDVRIWLTISQKYNAQEILRHLLNDQSSDSLAELGYKLYQHLFNRRYLIVMDDMWSDEVWNELKMYFPDNNIKSRIMLTTRFSHVAISLGSCEPYELTFLKKDKCWDLFCQTAFGKASCPFKNLEDVAKSIVRSCKGLPLEIVAIGRLLANSDMTLEYWKSIEEYIDSFDVREADKHCLEILSLSYKSLPIHLKPCFLYIRNFREDASINVSELINKWIAEGFIKAVDDKCLEDIAHEYLEDLIDRNLVFATSIKYGDIQAIGVHDLLLELCLMESDRERFIQSPKVQCITGKPDACLFCGEKIWGNDVVHLPHHVYVFLSSPKSTPACNACKVMYQHITSLLFVRAIVAEGTDRIVQPTVVRLASIFFYDNLKFVSPPIIHLLWNLQILDFDRAPELIEGNIVLPPHIWEMPQLRRLQFNYNVVLSNPVPVLIEGDDPLVLKNLESLFGVVNFKFTTEILARIPNLRKLGIVYYDESEETVDDDEFKEGTGPSHYSVSDLIQLHKLESLSEHVCGTVLESNTFPNSLKQLSLVGYKMNCEDMSIIIGSLPSLERLNLADCMVGTEWNPIVGQFTRLKKLKISGWKDLVCWTADESHFPKLQHLKLGYFDSLEEIPLEIGYISTLQSIELVRCSDSAVDSAKEIWLARYNFDEECVRIDVRDYTLAYQIGRSTARMTTKACASLAFLKNVLDELRELAYRGHNCLNTKQMETLVGDIHFLCDFLRVHFLRKSQELDGLSSEIVELARISKKVIDGLQSKFKHPSGMNFPGDVERVLEIMEDVKKVLSAAKEEGDDEQDEYESPLIDAIDNNAASCDDIESLKITGYYPGTTFDNDTNLRYYQIGGVTARMTGVANASWQNLATTQRVLQSVAECGLSTKQMETVDETIRILRDVVEVHPESKSQVMESLSTEIKDILDEAKKMKLRWSLRMPSQKRFSDVETEVKYILDEMKRSLGMPSQKRFSDENLLHLSEDVERLIKMIDMIKKQLSVDKRKWMITPH